MPLIGAGGTIALELHNCRNWKSTEDIINIIEKLIHDFGLVCIDDSTPLQVSDDGSTYYSSIDPTEIANHCGKSIEVLSNWNHPEFASSTYEHLCLWFRPPFIKTNRSIITSNEDLHVIAHAYKYGEDYSFIRFRGEISPRTSADQTLRIKYAEEFAQFLIRISETLASDLLPEYMWCAEDDEYAKHVFGEEVINKEFDTIYWMNYFGRGYLSEETMDLFKSAPIGFSRIENSTTWFQLHQAFDLNERQLLEEIEEKALNFFSEIGISRIQWTYEI